MGGVFEDPRSRPCGEEVSDHAPKLVEKPVEKMSGPRDANDIDVRSQMTNSLSDVIRRSELIVLALDEENRRAGPFQIGVVIHLYRRPKSDEGFDPGIVHAYTQTDHGSERKTANDKGQFPNVPSNPFESRPDVLLLPEPVFEGPRADPDPPEVEADRLQSQIRQGLGNPIHRLRVHGPPMKGVRMAEHRPPPEARNRLSHRSFQMAMRYGNLQE